MNGNCKLCILSDEHWNRANHKIISNSFLMLFFSPDEIIQKARELLRIEYEDEEFKEMKNYLDEIKAHRDHVSNLLCIIRLHNKP